MTPVWVETYLGLIFQAYGLAFFSLGLAALLSMRRDSGEGLSAHLGWLAAFGMMRGLQEFIDGEYLHNPATWLVVLGTLLMVGSFAMLLEFGRRLWAARPGGRWLAAPPLYTVVATSILIVILTAPATSAGLELAARYLLGAPGSVLAGLGLLAQARATVRLPGTVAIIRWLRVSALAMFGYAALTLFLSDDSAGLLANWLPTTADFLAATGLPVQLARALCAVLLAVGFVVICRRLRDHSDLSLRRVTDRLDGFVYQCRNDQNWSVTFLSEGGEILTGYPAADFLRGDRHFGDLIHSDDRQRVWSEVQAALAERREFQLHYRMVDRVGIVRQCYEEGRGAYDARGELLYLEGLVRNDESRHRAESARRRLQTMVEASPQAMGWADPDGTVRFFNAALRTLLAVPADAVLSGYRLRDFYDESAYAQIEATALPAAAAHGAWVGEIELTALDGRRVPTLHSMFVLRDEAGEVSAFANAITDLSDIRATQHELLIKDAAIASSTNAIALAGPDGVMTYVNRAFVTLWGLAGPEGAIGRSALSFWESPGHAQAVVDALVHAGHWQGELRGVRADGELFDVHLTGSMVLDSDGKPLVMMGSFQDVTARNRAQQALQQERDFAKSLLDTAPVIILLMDPKGMIRHVNLYFEQLTGYQLEEIVGKDWFSTFLPARDKVRIRGLFATAFHEGALHGNVNPIVTRTGEERAIEWHALHLRDDAGLITGMLSIGMDVTQRQQLESQLLELNHSLEQRVAERTAAAERANAAKSEFLSRMSHELRTPLNAILGFAQMLSLPGNAALTEQQAESVQEILGGGRHLLALVNEILDLARIESGRIELELQPLPLAPLMADCITQMQPLAVARGIAVSAPVDRSLVIQGDATRVKQVLFNLIANAIKYNREGGQVDVSVLPDGERLRIAVRDTGRGIAPEHLGRLFRPFERLESSYDAIEGTGIGLALVKRLAEAMGGEAGVESEQGVGSTFWFALPAGRLSDRPDDSVGPSAGTGQGLAETPRPTGGATRMRPRVLYIEDNPANLKLVQRILARRPELTMLDAVNAELGLELSRRERPELILLDINLPGMDGFAVLKALKADPGTAAIPVIAVTANAMPKDIERGRAAGFAEYLTKPIDVAGLLTAIDRHLGHASHDGAGGTQA